MKGFNQCKLLEDGHYSIAIRILLCFLVMSSCMVLGEFTLEETNGNSVRMLSSSILSSSSESADTVQLAFYVSAIYKLQVEKKLSGNDLTLLVLENSTGSTIFSTRVDMSVIHAFVPLDTYVLRFSGRLVNRPCVYTDLSDNCFGNSLITIRAYTWDDQVIIYSGPVNSEIRVDMKFLVTPLDRGNQPFKILLSSTSSTDLLLYDANESSFTETTTWPESIAQTDYVIVRYNFSLTTSQLTAGLDIRVRSATPLTIMLNSILIYVEPSPYYRITGYSREWRSVTAPGHLLIEGKNILAILIASKQIASVSTLVFDCSARLLTDTAYRYLATDQTVTGNHLVFDYDVTTGWEATLSPNAEGTLIYSFPFDSVEGLTSICFHVLNETINLTPTFTLSYQVEVITEIQSFSRSEKESMETQSDGSVVICYRVLPLAIYRRFIITFKNTGTTSMNVKIGEVQHKMNTVFRSETRVVYPQTAFVDLFETMCVDPSTTSGVTQFILFSTEYTALSSTFDVTLNSTTGRLCVLPTGEDVSFYIGVFGDDGYRYIPITVIRSLLDCEDESGNIMEHGTREVFEGECPTGFTGDTYRVCLNGTITDIQTDLCSIIPPSLFNYTVDEDYVLYEPFYLEPSSVSLYTSFSIVPSLPGGLSLNSTTGVISGIPTVNITDVMYTVTQSNDGGFQIFEFLLTLKYPGCLTTDDGYEGVDSGEDSSLPDCPEGYEGETYRNCFNGTFSEIQMDRCLLLPPPPFSYVIESHYYLYQSVTLTPNVTEIIGSFSSSLPDGLSINPMTGIISGIPISNGSFNITVDAINESGVSSFSFTLILLYLPCSLPNDSLLPSGDRIYDNDGCDYGYEGGSYRICFNGTLSNPHYDDCILLPPHEFDYDVESYYYLNSPLVLIPNITNFIASFSSSSLPDGLSINATTGIISGIPQTVVTNHVVIVNATNEKGSVTIEFLLTLKYLPCSSTEDGYEGVDSGEKSYKENSCTQGYSGHTYRLCNEGIFSDIHYDECILLPPPPFSYVIESHYYLYQSVTLTPNVTEIIGSFSSSLPDGLSINTTTGIISGIPISNGSFNITVDAINESGTASSSFTLILLYLPCSLPNDSLLPSGDRIYDNDGCDYGYEGGSYQICFNGTLSNPHYDDCILLPPSELTYSTTTLFVFVSFTLTPSISNLVSSFSITPQLPDTLSFNTTTGVIEGKVTTPLNESFTVTASNTAGNTSQVLQWTFVYPQCEDNGLIGDYGDEYKMKCYSWSFIGQKSRKCSLEGDSVQWMDLPNTCVAVHATVGGAFVLVCIVCIFLVIFVNRRGTNQVKVTVGEVYM